MPLYTELIRHSEITEPSTSVHSHISGLLPSGELCSLIVLEVSLWREPFPRTLVLSIFYLGVNRYCMRYACIMGTRSLMACCVCTFINTGNVELDARQKNLYPFLSFFNKLSDLSELLHQDVYI